MTLIVDFPQDSTRTSTRTNKKNSRAVSFASELEIQFITDLTINHKPDLWFSRHDMTRFKFDAAIDVRNIRAERRARSQDDYSLILLQENAVGEMSEEGAANSDTVSFLGLERHLSESTMQNIAMARQQLLRAVFVEQDRQLREGGVYRAETLASISEAESEWSRQRARLIGLLHASC